MCGIAGILSSKNTVSLSELHVMSDCLSHRGPDDRGFLLHRKNATGFTLIDGNGKQVSTELTESNLLANDYNCGVAHLRFAINELTASGHQPMVRDGVAIVFNGEIFNYKELRAQLISDGMNLQGNSDTEVFLSMYINHGIDCFDMLNGFWAAAIIDTKKDCLILTRDRFGEKPLYKYQNDCGLYFASEIRSFVDLAYTRSSNSLNYDSIFLYLSFDRRNTLTDSFYKNLTQVDPGVYEIYSLTTGAMLSTRKYWNFPAINRLEENGLHETTANFKSLLQDSVRIRLAADVPVAISLSGGIDSAAIAAFARSLDPLKDIKAFTINYEGDDALDETRAAAQIAKHLNIDHTILTISKEDVWDRLDEYISISEEPTHSVATLTQLIAWESVAKTGTKVLLHGSAADELMFGYSYLSELCDISKIREFKIPLSMQGESIFSWRNIGRLCKWTLNGKLFGHNIIKNKVPYNASFKICFDSIEKKYIRYYKVANGNEYYRRKADFSRLRIPYWCSSMDKNMMSIPLEVRSPFLDYRIIEYVCRLPSHYLYDSGVTKLLLRQSINDLLPAHIVYNKKKIGFSAPVDSWFKENDIKMFQHIAENLSSLLDISKLQKIWASIPAEEKWRYLNMSKWIEINID